MTLGRLSDIMQELVETRSGVASVDQCLEPGVLFLFIFAASSAPAFNCDETLCSVEYATKFTVPKRLTGIEMMSSAQRHINRESKD